MKKAYLIKMSEDGVNPYVYTNVKALFQGIIDTQYEVKFICNYNDKLIPLTYSNLVKHLKGKNCITLSKDADGYTYGTLEIINAYICSK